MYPLTLLGKAKQPENISRLADFQKPKDTRPFTQRKLDQELDSVLGRAKASDLSSFQRKYEEGISDLARDRGDRQAKLTEVAKNGEMEMSLSKFQKAFEGRTGRHII